MQVAEKMARAREWMIYESFLFICREIHYNKTWMFHLFVQIRSGFRLLSARDERFVALFFLQLLGKKLFWTNIAVCNSAGSVDEMQNFFFFPLTFTPASCVKCNFQLQLFSIWANDWSVNYKFCQEGKITDRYIQRSEQDMVVLEQVCMYLRFNLITLLYKYSQLFSRRRSHKTYFQHREIFDLMQWEHHSSLAKLQTFANHLDENLHEKKAPFTLRISYYNSVEFEIFLTNNIFNKTFNVNEW